jgi:hypothetical protein
VSCRPARNTVPDGEAPTGDGAVEFCEEYPFCECAGRPTAANRVADANSVLKYFMRFVSFRLESGLLKLVTQMAFSAVGWPES